MTKLSATLTMTPYAKRRVAETMYYRARSFITAAMLLRERGGYEFVVLHLLCQGIEVLLKSFLLYKDYDRYIRVIRSNIGHDLKKAADMVITEFGVHQLRPALADELNSLSHVYKQHLLRYASGYDHFVDPKSIKSDLVLSRLAAVVRLVHKSLPW